MSDQPNAPKPDDPAACRAREDVPQFEDSLALVVLAAGSGTRMRSALPKPLHTVAGVPMVQHVLWAGAAAQPTTTAVVVSPTTAGLTRRLSLPGEAMEILQDPPRGTGDALKHVALAHILDAVCWVLVLYADHPLLDEPTVAKFVEGARAARGRVALLTCVLPEAGSYGRVARDTVGNVVGIVEQADDDPALRQGPTEVWSGMMVLDAEWAKDALFRVVASPITGEYYLTELIEMAVKSGPVQGHWPVVAISAPPEVAYGVNDRVQLARAEQVARNRIRERQMLAGVTMTDPESVFIDADVEIGQDTTILPFCHLLQGTKIGRNCTIGPHATITGSIIGDNVTIRASTIEQATIASGADVGPYSHLRSGTELGPKVHIGNFAELKNARLGAEVKVGHVSYLGDVTIGDRTNVGAGTITANFDGVAKHQTTIGTDVFLGSDTVLRAPVHLGDGAVTGAGAVVTRDVPDGTTVVGVPARPHQKSPAGQRQMPTRPAEEK